MDKATAAFRYVLDRLAEQSTWRGIGFFIGLFTGKGAGLDWGEAAAIGGAISGAIKLLLPDQKKDAE